MSKAGQRLLKGAEQALAYAEGRAKPGTYRVHIPDSNHTPKGSETPLPKHKSDDTSVTEQAPSIPEEIEKTTA